MNRLWRSWLIASWFGICSLLVLAGCTKESEIALVKRFSNTTGFILEQIEKQVFDKEFLAALPKNFKRNTIYKEEKGDCIDNIGTGHCKYLKRHHACLTHTKKMMSYCNKTCNFCVPGKPKCSFTKYGCCRDMLTIATGRHYAGCPSGCVDRISEMFCKNAKQWSLCSTRNRGIMIKCRKTCGLCRPCIDEEPAKCQMARLHGLCLKLKFTMMNQCRKTCGLCGDRDPCGSVSCPKRQTCVVSRFGEAQCICRDTCRKGDHYTGVVCGRDDVDYANLCELKRSSCTGSAKKVKWYGECHPDVSYVKKVDCFNTVDKPSCKAWKKAGACISPKFRSRMMNQCPHECGWCAAKGNKPACYYSKHGCCLDTYTPCRGSNYEGCSNTKPCVNRFKHLCKRFVSACGERRNKLFMKNNCPSSCFYCPDSNKQA